MAVTGEYQLPDRPYFMQKRDSGEPDIVYTAADFRRFTRTLMNRDGVLSTFAFWVSQSDNVGFTIQVRNGYARVGNDYLVSLTATRDGIAMGVPTNPPATRVHKVWLAVYDKNYAGEAYKASVVVTEDDGTGADPPPDAAAYLLLANVTYKPSQPNVQNKDIVNVAVHGGTSAAKDQWLGTAFENGFEDAEMVTDAPISRATYNNGRVYLAGACRLRSGAMIVGSPSVVIGHMPTAFRPRSNPVRMTVSTSIDPDSAPYTARLQIDPDGTMRLHMSPGQKAQTIILDGASYDLDPTREQ